ncbi:IS66 family transposase [Blautia hansenii]|jgi:transposase|uniref:IS66 family transposase n=1 Tax=Blautia hansenii TaxID=1322 RepID=UPI000B7A2A85|nr:IS66 family transposase [Blautia hansenii]ASM68105.1 transposase [Blautia hansenii DSM 20583]ASM68803.1 transposase [Blautia hansenii DSM 20583]ASM69107.1 transposase [Blautia hansenii DSM 20583]UWO10686.1 IS66 family transposase [Blautia hansenii DSM 20583]UWO11391.1 IS66 family transposase [Blautia hansenii DSM 20583]
MAVKYTEEQLNSVDKSFLIQLLLQQQEQLEAITKELHASNEKMQLLMEQVILGKQNRFGRSSEKMEDTSQICFQEVDGTIVFFNEAEAVYDLNEKEPDELELKSPKQPKRKGKKESDLSGLTVRRIDHYLSEEELEIEFGVNGWKQLPDAISKKYHFVPARVEVEEHHIGVYASKTDEHMVKADHPKALLHGSLVSPSLGAAIINGKYVNAVPLYRLEQEFQRYGLQITRQNMANWCIRLAEEYLSILYDHLHEELYFYHVIQADETPLLVNHDGRKAGSKSWMWVYRSGHLYQDRQIVLYEYQQTRNASHPREFLKGYDGICVTDGYQVYHTLEKELEELTIAGCWVHCRRRFDEALKLIPKPSQKESNAFLLMKQIQAIYREEGKLNDLSSDERLKQRQAVIKPLVDAFFAYLKTINVSKKDKFGDAVRYARNQEKYLRVFLTDGDVPIDNNASERAIRGFCIGKKNWQMIDTIHGAKSSAIIYSIVETAKANNLKPFDYVQHLLEEIPKHMNDKDCSFLEDLLPWSEKLPAGIRKA